MITVQAPAPYQNFQTKGASYVADVNGVISNVAPNDLKDLINEGCAVLQNGLIQTPVGPCKFGGIQTRLPFSGGLGAAGGAYTVGGVFTAESDFDWVRLVYLNFSTTAYTVTSAAVAPSANLNDAANPLTAAGGAQAWSNVTFNNAGAPGDIPSPAGATRTIMVPAGVQNSLSSNSASDIVPGVAYSDWINIQSIVRNDGYSFPFIFVRTYCAAAFMYQSGAPTSISPVGGAAYDAYANGRLVRGYAKSATDYATTPGVIPTPSLSDALIPHAVQFMSRKRGMTVASYGDSLFQGYGTASGQNSPFSIACMALSTPQFPVISHNGGFQGASSLSSVAAAYAELPGILPEMVFVKCISPNDNPQTAATAEAAIARAFALADWCTRRNIVPVLVTEAPFYNPGTTTWDALRAPANAAIRASNYLYVDWDAVLSDGNSPANQQAQYIAGSRVSPHYNDLGSQALSVAVMAAIQKVMAARPR